MKIILAPDSFKGTFSAAEVCRVAACGPRRVYVATAEPGDAEMAARIATHRAARGPGWTTIEAPLDLSAALDALPAADAAVVDCLTLWLSNRLGRGEAPADILATLDAVVARAAGRPHPVFVVTNEVGMGIVPESPLARVFRDLAGRAHQQVAAAADEVWFAALGLMLRLRPDPVVAVAPTEAS